MIQVRQETERDYFETESMFREAFWNHYTPACSEHYLVHRMRSCPAFVPELALVAVDGGRIVGGAMCLRAYILGDNGTRYAVLSLGPLGVLPAYQNRGIGGLLIARTKKIAAGMDGICGILLCGDPDYYVRQGFVPAERFGIRNGENLFADALQVYELHAGALSQAKGLYLEDAIYAVRTLARAGYGTVGVYDHDLSGTWGQLSAEADLAIRSFEDLDAERFLSAVAERAGR